MAYPATVVFVHGWSVTHTDTYGGLPQRLAAEASAAGRPLALRELFLARYVSFHDEVRLEDLARAMEAAVRAELGDLLAAGERFAVVTHSTGGPLAREWWWRFYVQRKDAGRCPMSHLVMLAPANFGSALAQLGASRLSRLKTWFQGVEPGTGVLDWLEHGSPESWALNEAWIRGRFGKPGPESVFPFVLTGQSIDRKLYDHLNSYTGEMGSDGVVRVPAANLNAALLRLEQGEGETLGELRPVGRVKVAPRSVMRLIAGASHSGEEMGIMRSIRPPSPGDDAQYAVSPILKDKSGAQGVVGAILRCLEVDSAEAYDALRDDFEAESRAIGRAEQVELQRIPILPDRVFVHDPTSLVLFRVVDSEGYALTSFDLELTGERDDPDLLPEGFLLDRQCNHRARNVLTFHFDEELMRGGPALPDPRSPGRELRPAHPGLARLGLRITPRPAEGFVRYAPCAIQAEPKLLKQVIRPGETTLVEIVLRRLVERASFALGPADAPRASFAKVRPSGGLAP